MTTNLNTLEHELAFFAKSHKLTYQSENSHYRFQNTIPPDPIIPVLQRYIHVQPAGCGNKFRVSAFAWHDQDGRRFYQLKHHYSTEQDMIKVLEAMNERSSLWRLENLTYNVSLH
jgi:hypothetical protein